MGVEALKSQYVEKNTRAVEDFICRLDVLPYDEKAACHCGSIRSDREKKGITLGVNDLHIAGHARSSGLVVVTNNEHAFKRVNGLIVENCIPG